MGEIILYPEIRLKEELQSIIEINLATTWQDECNEIRRRLRELICKIDKIKFVEGENERK